MLVFNMTNNVYHYHHDHLAFTKTYLIQTRIDY